jgi:hypothetical protein
LIVKVFVYKNIDVKVNYQAVTGFIFYEPFGWEIPEHNSYGLICIHRNERMEGAQKKINPAI